MAGDSRPFAVQLPESIVERYFLTNPLSVTETDDPNPERRFCIFVGERAFHGSARVAQLLDAVAHTCELDRIAQRVNAAGGAAAMSE